MILLGCDNKPSEAKADPVEKQAKEDADAKARLEKRKQEREAKAAAEEQAKKDVEAAIDKVTTLPDGTKFPKKPEQACDAVVAAQKGFMKKFHPDIEEAAVTTQTGLLRKQCMDMKDVKVATCQAAALGQTTDQLKGAINEYLPACMKKYGGK
jgi:hypothetical protein